MSGTQARVVLEEGAKRTAQIETDAGGARVFVKRFHARGPIDRHFDAHRARSEHAALARLRTLGIAAPEPLDVRVRAGSYELVTRWIEGSAPLADVLDGRVTAACARETIDPRQEVERETASSRADASRATASSEVAPAHGASTPLASSAAVRIVTVASSAAPSSSGAASPLAAVSSAQTASPAAATSPRARVERETTALSRTARALGRLIAQLHERGVAHPDLHAGNALVLEDGGVALVDAHGLRFGKPLAIARRLSDLVTCCADARERTSTRFRARVFLAWWRATSPLVRAELPARAELVEEIERSARLRRRAGVVKSARRWTRTSSVAVEIRRGDVRGIAARSRTPREIERALELALTPRDATHSDAGARSSRASTRGALEPDDRAAPLLALRWRESARAVDWTSAARLVEHGVATAAPVVLVRKPRRAAVFALPLDARTIHAHAAVASSLERRPRDARPIEARAADAGPLEARTAPPSQEGANADGASERTAAATPNAPPREPIDPRSPRSGNAASLDRAAQRARLARGLGELCGTLADRGLALARGSLVRDLAGRVLVDVGAHLDPCDAFDPSRALAPARAWRSGASRFERARFCVAFVRAWRGSARERAHVRARLVDG